ncbi:MAG TPA: hypothetical protein VGD01_13970 [Candidatus Elarobacter sp.]|jgi:hypothetical protein
MNGESAAALPATQVVPLGTGTVTIRVPANFIIDLEPGFEIVFYRIVEADRTRYRRILIALTGTAVAVEIPGPRRAICINGLRGEEIRDEDGGRSIVLNLPPSSGMFKMLVGSSRDDPQVEGLLRSIAVRGYRGHC